MLLLSSTSLQSFKRCRKSFELQYARGLAPKQFSDAITFGLGFHEIVENAAKLARGDDPDSLNATDMPTDETVNAVAATYLENFGMPSNILLVEDPVWFKLDNDVFLRMTFDRVHVDPNDWIVDTDYKTFTKKPTLDVDLDFQGRLYAAGLMAMYPGASVRRQYHNVRQELGRELKGKGWVDWTYDERYQIVTLVCGRAQAEKIRRETLEIVKEIKVLTGLSSDSPRWYRTELKGDMPHSCGQCFVKEACKKDLQDDLDEQTIDLLYNRREPLAILEGANIVDFTEDLTL